MKKVLTIAALLMLTCLGARAEQTVNIVVKPSAAAGTVTYKITGKTNGVGGVCTLTVTPASGYYLKADNLTATTSLDGGGVQGRTRTDEINVSNETLNISPTSTEADPSSVTIYTFNMPTDGSLNVDVTAEFKALEAINPTVTLTEWTYGGEPNEPVVEGNPGGGAVTFYYKAEGAEAFTNTPPTDAGTHTVKASVAAAREYAAGEATNTFTISKANLADATISKLTVGGNDYTGSNIEIQYTGEAIQPSVVVTLNDGSVTIDESEYTVSYSNNTNVSGVDESATVTITSTGKNFTADTRTSKDFKIVAAQVTIRVENKTVTYNGQAQAYDGATVDNANATLDIAYYKTEEERSKGSNALTGAPTDAGTYYIKVTQTNANYTADPCEATFTIDKAQITTVSLANDELEYNNGNVVAVEIAEVKAGTIDVPDDAYTVSGNDKTETGNYTLTVTAKDNGNFTGNASTTYTIKDRTAQIAFDNDEQTYKTFYSANEDFLVPDGVAAYMVTGVSGNTVTIQKVSYLKKGVALLLEKSTGSTSEKNPNENFDSNKLKFASIAATATVATGKEYVLYMNEFVKATVGSSISGKCYLEVTSGNGARSLSIVHGDDDTAGINDVTLDMDSKNGQWYDLQGRKINKPTKAGLYILNGKKISVKSQTK